MSKTKLGDHFDMKTPVYYSQQIPECEILVNKQKRKSYGKKKSKVYLNNGDDIQIHLFNPHHERIGAQLEFNGKKEEKLLVINPGQKVLLDRFVDSKKKIKFSTYFVYGNNKQVKEAIKDNGNLRIHFWTDTKPVYNYNYNTSSYYSGSYSGTSGWDGGTCGTSGSSGTDGTSGTSGSGVKLSTDYKRVKSKGLPHFTNSTSIVDKDRATKKWAPILDTLGIQDQDKRDWMAEYAELHQLNEDIAYSTLYNMNGMGAVTQPKMVETGRIEKGEKSKQKMTEVDFNPEKVFYVKNFKLLPFSELKSKKKSTAPKVSKPKSVTVDVHNNYYRNTDYRIYCSNPHCGYRIRNRSWKFCPICSTEIE